MNKIYNNLNVHNLIKTEWLRQVKEIDKNEKKL